MTRTLAGPLSHTVAPALAPRTFRHFALSISRYEIFSGGHSHLVSPRETTNEICNFAATHHAPDAGEQASLVRHCSETRVHEGEEQVRTRVARGGRSGVRWMFSRSVVIFNLAGRQTFRNGLRENIVTRKSRERDKREVMPGRETIILGAYTRHRARSLHYVYTLPVPAWVYSDRFTRRLRNSILASIYSFSYLKLGISVASRAPYFRNVFQAARKIATPIWKELNPSRLSEWERLKRFRNVQNTSPKDYEKERRHKTDVRKIHAQCGIETRSQIPRPSQLPSRWLNSVAAFRK